jgi:hypothetical protein
MFVHSIFTEHEKYGIFGIRVNIINLHSFEMYNSCVFLWFVVFSSNMLIPSRINSSQYNRNQANQLCSSVLYLLGWGIFGLFFEIYFVNYYFLFNLQLKRNGLWSMYGTFDQIELNIILLFVIHLQTMSYMAEDFLVLRTGCNHAFLPSIFLWYLRCSSIKDRWDVINRDGNIVTLRIV